MCIRVLHIRRICMVSDDVLYTRFETKERCRKPGLYRFVFPDVVSQEVAL
jgi:hypothetical protein